MDFLDRLDQPEGEGPSEFTLDQLHLGLLEGDEKAAVEAQVAASPALQAAMARRAQGFDAFAETDDRALLAAVRRRLDEAESQSLAGRFRAWWGGALLLALGPAAAVVIAVRTPAPAPSGEIGDITPGVTRLKGDVPFRVYRARGADVAQAASGDLFQAGDRLMFEVDLKAKGHLKVFGVEPSGAVYQAWPPPGQAMDTLREVGPAQRLPGAVALDATAGKETLYAVLCPEAVGAPACQADAAEKRGMRCTQGCAFGAFVMVKR